MRQPTIKPHSPCFGSGPTKKHPGWKLSAISQGLLGRSHRSPSGVEYLTQLIELTRHVLNIPATHQIALLPGSATGAIECALWSFLGSRPVDVFAWDVFGSLWIVDVVEQLKLSDKHVFQADFGHLPDLNQHNPDHDVIFTYNGTSAGVVVPNLEWIAENRKGLTICDATSAAFVVDLDWSKLDVTCFSWQKGLGGEGGHGMMVLSPKAIQHLLDYTPSWPIPRLFRLTKNGQIIDGIFIGKTINTPSMLCAADCMSSLEWAKSLGSIQGLVARSQYNFSIVKRWLDHHPFLTNLAVVPETQSSASVCFTFQNQQGHEHIQKTVSYLAEKEVAYDIKNHYLAPPSFRLWCGPTVEAEDLAALLPWIDWCLHNL